MSGDANESTASVIRPGDFPFLLSVIIPAYNEEATIGQLLDRVARAPYPQQIIVVDDGVDPGILGIDFSLPPSGPPDPGDGPPRNSAAVGPLPGWYAVSVSLLKGLEFSLWTGDGGRQFVGRPGFTYFQEFEPVARAGYSIYIYHLSIDDVNPVRRRLGLDPLMTQKPEG
jgi:cellulose synthase/poly-beta-1,6-N-acetylglucosamine synthase-like glycosyltransferase